MQLTTKRFVLRDFVGGDLPAFAAYHADPRSSALYGPDACDPEHAAELIRLFTAWATEQPRLNFQLAVIRRDHSFIGCGGLRTKDVGQRRAELGVELAPVYWGRFGYATEIMKCLVDFGFRDMELAQIFGSTVSANARVARLARAFGAKSVERSTPDWMAVRGWQRIEWQINRDQWLARPSDHSFKPNPLRGSA